MIRFYYWHTFSWGKYWLSLFLLLTPHIFPYYYHTYYFYYVWESLFCMSHTVLLIVLGRLAYNIKTKEVDWSDFFTLSDPRFWVMVITQGLGVGGGGGHSMSWSGKVPNTCPGPLKFCVFTPVSICILTLLVWAETLGGKSNKKLVESKHVFRKNSL